MRTQERSSIFSDPAIHKFAKNANIAKNASVLMGIGWFAKLDADWSFQEASLSGVRIDRALVIPKPARFFK